MKIDGTDVRGAIEDMLCILLVALGWLMPMLRIDMAATVTWAPLILVVGAYPTVLLGLGLSHWWFDVLNGDDREAEIASDGWDVWGVGNHS